jgi:hypothetical protein
MVQAVRHDTLTLQFTRVGTRHANGDANSLPEPASFERLTRRFTQPRTPRAVGARWRSRLG